MLTCYSLASQVFAWYTDWPALPSKEFTHQANFQVCLRLYQANQRVADPEMDNLVNPHEVRI